MRIIQVRFDFKVELKSCCAMLRNDVSNAGVCSLTIIKQGVTLTNHAREIMNTPPTPSTRASPSSIGQQLPTTEPTTQNRLHPQFWEKKT